jgi:hypothetical protein
VYHERAGTPLFFAIYGGKMKPWYESKTVWFNVITMLLGIIPIVGAFVKLIEPQTAVVIDGVLAMVAGIGNVILRVWFTTEPIATAAHLTELLGPK